MQINRRPNWSSIHYLFSFKCIGLTGHNKLTLIVWFIYLFLWICMFFTVLPIIMKLFTEKKHHDDKKIEINDILNHLFCQDTSFWIFTTITSVLPFLLSIASIIIMLVNICSKLSKVMISSWHFISIK